MDDYGMIDGFEEKAENLDDIFEEIAASAAMPLCHDKDQEDEFDPDDENCFNTHLCKREVTKIFSVHVPVFVKPYAKAHKPIAQCLGDVRVSPGCISCDEKDKSFCFTISQDLSLKIPVKYGVMTCYRKMCAEEIDKEELIRN